MDLLDRFERLLERIVDGGILSRLARTVQPSEIAKRLAKEMEFNFSRGLVGPTGRIAPNDFTVRLNPEDFREYEPSCAAFESHIATYLDDYAGRQRITLLGPAAVHLVSDARQPRHTLGIESRILGQPAAVPLAPVAPPTSVISRTPPRSVAAPLPPASDTSHALVDLSNGARTILKDQPVTLGRSLGNTLVSSNEYVSRSHAEIRVRNGRYSIRDLGSSNGTFVNDRRVSEEAYLSANDLISLGPPQVGHKLRFEQARSGT